MVKLPISDAFNTLPVSLMEPVVLNTAKDHQQLHRTVKELQKECKGPHRTTKAGGKMRMCGSAHYSSSYINNFTFPQNCDQTYNPLTFISTLCNSQKLSLLDAVLSLSITLVTITSSAMSTFKMHLTVFCPVNVHISAAYSTTFQTVLFINL